MGATPRDWMDVVKDMTTNNGDNRRTARKNGAERSWLWLRDQASRLINIRNGINLALLLTILALLVSVFGVYQTRDTNSMLRDLLDEQRKFVERIRIKGEFASEFVPQSQREGRAVSLTHPSRLVEIQHPADSDAGQLIAHGEIGEVQTGNSLWIGVQSGTLFWPRIRLPDDASANETFSYRLTSPPGVKSGALIVAEVGPSTDRIFRDRQEYSLRQGQEVGLFLPHLKDMYILSSKDFQLTYPSN